MILLGIGTKRPLLLEYVMLVAGVKSEAPGDSLDTPVEGCVTLLESETETNGS